MRFIITPSPNGQWMQANQSGNAVRVQVLNAATVPGSTSPVIEADSLDALKTAQGLVALLDHRLVQLAALFAALSSDGMAATIGLRRDIMDARDSGHPKLIPILIRKFSAGTPELKTAQTQALALFAN